MRTDSDLEHDFRLDQYKEVTFKVRFDEVHRVDEIVAEFCEKNEIRKTDQCSLLNHVIITLETEKIAIDSQNIVRDIAKSFKVVDLIQGLRSSKGLKDAQSKFKKAQK